MCYACVQSRARIFQALVHYAQQGGGEQLSAALGALCDNPYVLPDTPESHLAEYGKHYRWESEGLREIL